MTISSTSSAFRPGVVTSTNRPVTPYEGQVIYETDTDRTLVYNNSAWVDPSTGKDGRSGLVFLKESTLSTVANNISDVFSTDYNAYKVVIDSLVNSTGTTRQLFLRFRNASGDDTTSNYFHGYRLHYGGTGSDGQTSGANLIELGYFSSGGNSGGSVVMDIVNPFLSIASMVTYTMIAYQGNVSNYVIRHGGGGINTSTSYTGFSIIGTTDNISGTVRVYGYNQ